MSNCVRACVIFIGSVFFGFVENAIFPPDVAGFDIEMAEDTMSPPIEESINRFELSPVMVRFVDMSDYTRSVEERQNLPDVISTKNTTKKTGMENNAVESWCVIWYLGAFGSLVCFFLIITCTELFFGNPLYRDNNLNAFVHSFVSSEKRTGMPGTPPPPYHLFAPPDYHDTVQTRTLNDKRGNTLEVLVVPVHGRPAATSTAATAVINIEPPRYDETRCKIVEDKLNVFVIAGQSNPVQ